MEEFIGFFFSFLFLKCFALAVAIALVSERLNRVSTFNNTQANKSDAVIDVEYEVVDIAEAPRSTPPRQKNARRSNPPLHGRKCNAHVSWAESLSILRSAG